MHTNQAADGSLIFRPLGEFTTAAIFSQVKWLCTCREVLQYHAIMGTFGMSYTSLPWSSAVSAFMKGHEPALNASAFFTRRYNHNIYQLNVKVLGDNCWALPSP